MFLLCSLKSDACSSMWEMSARGVQSVAVLFKLTDCFSVSKQQNQFDVMTE